MTKTKRRTLLIIGAALLLAAAAVSAFSFVRGVTHGNDLQVCKA